MLKIKIENINEITFIYIFNVHIICISFSINICYIILFYFRYLTYIYNINDYTLISICMCILSLYV